MKRQSFQDIEWLVLDDSEHPSATLANNDWVKLRYFHSPERMSIGKKRNQLLDAAKGSIVVQFDDDDYYGPNYVSSMAKVLNDFGA